MLRLAGKVAGAAPLRYACGSPYACPMQRRLQTLAIEIRQGHILTTRSSHFGYSACVPMRKLSPLPRQRFPPRQGCLRRGLRRLTREQRSRIIVIIALLVRSRRPRAHRPSMPIRRFHRGSKACSGRMGPGPAARRRTVDECKAGWPTRDMRFCLMKFGSWSHPTRCFTVTIPPVTRWPVPVATSSSVLSRLPTPEASPQWSLCSRNDQTVQHRSVVATSGDEHEGVPNCVLKR